MTQAESQGMARGGMGVWIFRVLLLAGAAFMAYSWFAPWWSADVAVVKGTDDLVLHPWGVEVARQVRVSADPSLYSMPGFFAPFTWAYFAVAMLAMAVSLFVNKRVSLGPINLPLATVLILFVGLSYLVAVGLAYGIGEMRATSIGTNFIGKSEFTDPSTHRKMKMVSDLRVGYWYALYAGVGLVVLGLLRGLFYRQPKA